MKKKKDAGRRIFGKALTADPDDAPELLEGFFAEAEVRDGDRIVRRGRPPLGERAKVRVALRIDSDVLAAYKKDGAGWQTRINTDLRRIKKLKRA